MRTDQPDKTSPKPISLAILSDANQTLLKTNLLIMVPFSFASNYNLTSMGLLVTIKTQNQDSLYWHYNCNSDRANK